MTIGQCVRLDGPQVGVASDATAMLDLVVAITAPLAGSLTLTDKDGNVLLTNTTGQSGSFALPGTYYGVEYALTSAADLGLVTIAFHPI